MVEIMRDVWKNLLIDDTCEPDGQEKLPSPATLRRKILVKVKHAAPSGKGDGKIEATQSTKPKTPSSSSSSSSDTEIAKDDPQKEKKKKVKMLDALSGLGLYTRSYHFSSFDQPEATIPTHVFSLSEKALMGMQETHAPALFAHNRKYLMRAYPKGLRVSSSNLDPSVFWRRGVQMVALNWQKWDEGMMLNEGMFAGEGGWVLKPRGYRSGDEFAGKVGSSEGLVHGILDLTIQVFAGQSIPLPPGDDRPNSFHPYAKFELHSESAEEKAGRPTESKGRVKGGEHKARTHARKGTDPDFEGETLRFSAVAGVVEELSFLRLKIHDDEIGKDGMAAWSCIRLDRLQQGIRILSLMDTAGRESAGILLVRITKTLS
ncbi:MAG: hypothetical protein M1817_002516 [Caeruleum heppii]|nr:MAG: hypothetical protein M1817_002516 [Caeruleum heppii]